MNNIDLISVFSDDDYILDDSAIPKYPQDTPRETVGQLRHENLTKFKAKWSAIIEKYLQVDDSTQSDEVDLATGIIYTDNGHLRLMKEPSSTIWIEHDSVEAQDRRHQRRKRRARSRLKQQGLFTNQLFEHDRLVAGSNPLLKTISEQFSDHLSRTRSPSISPAKRRPGLTGSLDCDDNILLVTPSPKKRRPEHLPGANAPFGNINTSSRLSGSPRVEIDSDSASESASEEDTFEQRLFLRDYVSQQLATNDEYIEQKTTEDSLLVPSYNISDKDELLESSSPLMTETEEETSYWTAVTTLAEKTRQRDPRMNQMIERDVKDSKVEDSEDSVDFSDEFSIISMGSNDDLNDLDVFTCPFTCVFGTGNKQLFAKHLLENHPEELASAGYSAPESHKPVVVDEEIVRYLHGIFPLIHPVPSLPITPDLRPLTCGRDIDGKRCEKWFLSRPELKFHTDNSPYHCSSKRQVILCPVLGCGYMTDEGYLHWRDHMIQAGHCQKKTKEIKNNDSSSEDIFDNVLDTLGDDADGYTSIDELFDD